jgi:hypothetical protein
VSGVVSQADRLQLGQMMVQGLPGVTIVASNRSWIEANFKETDLAHMRVGQPAEITFDAYPELKLRGKVSSIGAGTGSEFSVLPAQNANGNWVKVTQRVPVRIAITDKPKRVMIAGLSARSTGLSGQEQSAANACRHGDGDYPDIGFDHCQCRNSTYANQPWCHNGYRHLGPYKLYRGQRRCDAYHGLVGRQNWFP